jgi:hypothetical protein
MFFSAIVIAIDNENSTHLNGRGSEGHGREDIWTVLCSHFSKVDDLVVLLSDSQKTYDFVGELAVAGKRKNFSFATKFCHYCALYLLTEDKRDSFSIFDSVMEKSLPQYIRANEKLRTNQKFSDFVSRNALQKKVKSLNSPTDFSDFYKKYQGVIDALIGDSGISRNGFDHIVWYSSK